MSRIVKGEPYKMISTPSGVVAFGPFGKAKVDDETYAWIEERVKKGKLSGVFLEETLKEKEPEKEPEPTEEKKEAQEEKASSKKGRKKKAK